MYVNMCTQQGLVKLSREGHKTLGGGGGMNRVKMEEDFLGGLIANLCLPLQNLFHGHYAQLVAQLSYRAKIMNIKCMFSLTQCSFYIAKEKSSMELRYFK